MGCAGGAQHKGHTGGAQPVHLAQHCVCTGGAHRLVASPLVWGKPGVNLQVAHMPLGAASLLTLVHMDKWIAPHIALFVDFLQILSTKHGCCAHIQT